MMKTIPVLLLLLFSLLCGMNGIKAQQQNGLTEDQLRLKQEVKPYLDSLTIEEPQAGDKDISLFRVESVFPEKPFTRFGSNEGKLTTFIPDNPKQHGLITEPIPLLGGTRISMVYSLTDDYEKNIPIELKYRFESVREKNDAGEDMVRQSLYLNVQGGLRFSRIKTGMMEVKILPGENEGKQINNVPSLGYRSMSFYRTGEYRYRLSYLLRSSEGVYSPALRSEGSDRTTPEYVGGSAAQFWFLQQNMQYPEEAVQKQVSGTVLISCIVEPDGSVTNPHVFLGSEPLLNDEAIRLVGLTSGKWIPATYNGENIADEKVIPVTFRLDDQAIQTAQATEKPEKKLPIKTYLLLFALAAGVVFYLWNKFFKKDTRPDPSLRPNVLVSNDKMVVITGVNGHEAEKMIRSFTYIYNCREYEAIIRMHQMHNQVFVLTFPYDISWEMFLELMDHLFYFDEGEHKPQVHAWLTLPEICEPVAGQHAMLYEYGDDKEYDVLYVTTQHNQGWKVDYETQKLKETKVVEEYAQPPFPYYEIVQADFIEID